MKRDPVIARLVRSILVNRMSYDENLWEVQGFGFMRFRIDANTRLHIWNTGLRVKDVSDIHDHSQWAFTSHTISGAINNIRFRIVDHAPKHQLYKMWTINCGIGGGMTQSPCEQVLLEAEIPERYESGQSYHQEPDEIHRTLAHDNTVTLIVQERYSTMSARVFGKGEWVDAIPRIADREEVEHYGGLALEVFGEV